MSKMEDYMTSQKYDLSQVKMMMQILVNNKGHRNVVSIPHAISKPPDLTGYSGT